MCIVPLKIRKPFRDDLADLILNWQNLFASDFHEPIRRTELAGLIDDPITKRDPNPVKGCIALQAFIGCGTTDSDVLTTDSQLQLPTHQESGYEIAEGVFGPSKGCAAEFVQQVSAFFTPDLVEIVR